jgi:hypothetical protein
MAILRRVVVWVAVLYWACQLGIHLVVAAVGGLPSGPGSFFALDFFLTFGVATAVLWVTKPADRAEYPTPRWYCGALGVVALICGFWPMVVGSGVPNTGFNPFVDTGVPAGEPGDRYLNSHGRRVRALTEEEFRRARAWDTVQVTGIMACFAGMILAGALYFQQVRSEPNPALQPTPPRDSPPDAQASDAAVRLS